MDSNTRPNSNAICAPEAPCPECTDDESARQQDEAYRQHVAACTGNRTICALYDHL